jgi:hypothetical protein
MSSYKGAAMTKKLLVLCFLLSLVLAAKAQAVLDSAGRDPGYVKTILARSRKIVDGLNLNNGSSPNDVANIVANRYFELNDIDKKYGTDKAAYYAELYIHHFEFAAMLSNYLTADQIEKIKDGMTYGVVPKTYEAYLEMIPSLKNNEKLQILNWLKEAREFAVDAGSAQAKHACFGKYKGRINNWLSKRGYNLTAERQEWMKRIENQKKK